MWLLRRADAATRTGSSPYIPPNSPDPEAAQVQLCNASGSLSSLSSLGHSDGHPKALHADSPRDAGRDDTPTDVQFKLDSSVQELSADSGHNLDLLDVVNEDCASSLSNAFHTYTDSESVTSIPPPSSHLCPPTNDNVLYQLLSMNDSDEESASSKGAPADAERAPPVAPVLADNSEHHAPAPQHASSEQMQHSLGRRDLETGNDGYSSEDLSVSAISDSVGSSPDQSP